MKPGHGAVPDRFLPRRPPSGTDHFGTLFRDPVHVTREIVADQLARRAFADLRPTLLAVAQHIGKDGTRITELAERALLTKATVVRTVDELERLGYVTRRPDPTDGRAKLVVSTARAPARPHRRSATSAPPGRSSPART